MWIESVGTGEMVSNFCSQSAMWINVDGVYVQSDVRICDVATLGSVGPSEARTVCGALCRHIVQIPRVDLYPRICGPNFDMHIER